MPDAQTPTGPDPVCRLTAADLPALGDSYIVILATLGPAELRRPAALIAQGRNLWLAARPVRHYAIMNEAMASHVQVREAA